MKSKPNSPLDLFTKVANEERLHDLFKILLDDYYAPEREILTQWASEFKDRDGKFVYEFQTTFESSLWELYIFAALKELKAEITLPSFPDFSIRLNDQFMSIEATIASNAHGESPAYGFGIPDMMPKGLDEFNKESILRLCNCISAKYKKYVSSYSKIKNIPDNPFVLAITSFDRPGAHLAAYVPIIATLYGIYIDESTTICQKTQKLLSFPISSVKKNENSNVGLGYFCSKNYSDISAVIYSSVANFSKITALTNDNSKVINYITVHPGEPDNLQPNIKNTPKNKYKENLLDGLYVFHNPFAKKPIPLETFSHTKIAQYYVSERKLNSQIPDDFLFLRNVIHAVGSKNSSVFKKLK